MRDATAAAHQRTEASAGFRHTQQGTLTLQTYAELLGRWHGRCVPAERAILRRAVDVFTWFGAGLDDDP